MRWADSPFRFSRPLHGLLCVFGGRRRHGLRRVQATDGTVGHRIAAPGPSRPGLRDYKGALERSWSSSIPRSARKGSSKGSKPPWPRSRPRSIRIPAPRGAGPQRRTSARRLRLLPRDLSQPAPGVLATPCARPEALLRSPDRKQIAHFLVSPTPPGTPRALSAGQRKGPPARSRTPLFWSRTARSRWPTGGRPRERPVPGKLGSYEDKASG